MRRIQQADFIILAAIWMHLVGGLSSLLLVTPYKIFWLEVLYQQGLSQTACGIGLIGVAALALVPLIRQAFVTRITILCLLPQQFLLLFSLFSTYQFIFAQHESWLATMLYGPATVPLTIFHTLRLIRLIQDGR